MASAMSYMIASVLQSPFQLGVSLCALILFTLKTARFLSDRRRNPSRLPFPPGPKGYPLIGSVFDMPTSKPWLTYANWAKIYGNILSFEVLGQRIIVLSSLEDTQELFEKRSSNYSDRPRLPMLVELMKSDFNFGLMPYGSRWRRHRRLFDEHFRANVVWKYQPVLDCETRLFLNRLLHTPGDFLLHIRQSLASSILKITHGIEVSKADDPYIVNIEEAMKGLNAATAPGAFLVDMIPALKYVPSWFPGAGFKKKAAYWAKVNQDVVELPYNHIVQQIKEGTAGPSIAATLITALSEGDKKPSVEESSCAQNVAAVAYFGGADTSISAIQTFFLAMAMHPDIQKKAQAELDTVIGSHRLPGLDDRPSLTYVNALIKETLRWQPVAPLGLPHTTTDDDVYDGYFIPKGSLVMGNVWALLHDEKEFTEPGEFHPERYLKSGELDPSVRQPEVSTFGFGRRICPGRFLAENTLFLIVSSTLHSFNITPAVDEQGVPIPLSKEVTSEMLSYPEPFKVNIKPRSPSAEILVREGILGND